MYKLSVFDKINSKIFFYGIETILRVVDGTLKKREAQEESLVILLGHPIFYAAFFPFA